MGTVDTAALDARLAKLEDKVKFLEQYVDEHIIFERIRPLEDHLERNGAVLS